LLDKDSKGLTISEKQLYPCTKSPVF